ncbi:Fc receptor-like protein 5 isoform X2 [Melanotaenia boesemani]|uniref:Fc receptor-like protein 5 isoform X2 n=1 Tax=Melanotaenia boesemani TaxID=1250792 RepID=UPI001C04D706|nr:Fc receptor-like protein 5 isoform X2 [Melanotaenia boesemani]
MLLTPFCLTLTCLQVLPNRSQFFRYNSVSLSCEDERNSTGWKVKRKTPDGGIRPCSSGWGYVSSGSTCIIANSYPTDTGVYWCESEKGEQSNSVNITITDRTVILESPALPVLEGAAATLYCKAETNTSDHTYDFFKDGHVIITNSSGEMTIDSVSKSNEGLYTCSISGGGESAGSWLAVSVPFEPSSSAPSSAPTMCSVLRLLCHLAVGMPYMFSTILLGLICRDRKRAQMVTDQGGRDDVIMEILV